MPARQTKHEIKTCPRCGRLFECKLNNPVHCDCARVVLPEETMLAIQERFRDCLCLACLTELAGGADPAGAGTAAGERGASGDAPIG